VTTLADYQHDLLAQLLTNKDAPGGDTDLATRLSIYRRNILGSRFAVLQQLFPCVEKLLGKDYFQQLGEIFLQQHPSHDVAISNISQPFVAFIQQHEVMQHVAYIADVALFEAAWYRVFHGRNNPEATASLKSLVDVELIDSAYPVHLLWEMCQPEYRGDFQLPERSERTYLLLVQRNHAIEMMVLSKEQWQALES